MDTIKRLEETREGSAPWVGIKFTHDIGSDDLSDHLKKAYPEGRNERERKYMAVIKFFQQELEKIQSPTSNVVPPHDIQSGELKSDINTYSNGSRLQSTSPGDSTAASGSGDSPRLVSNRHPGADNPQFAPFSVWNVFDGQTTKPKTKRKMTEAERKEYKRVRLVGACDHCRKQKGKVWIAYNDTSKIQRPTLITSSAHI